MIIMMLFLQPPCGIEDAINLELKPTPFFTETPERDAINAIGAVVSAANFMGATINEFLNFRVTDSHYGMSLALSGEEKSNIDSWWDPNEINMSILNKYQNALEKGGKTKFDETIKPFEDAQLLVYLRNQIVHYKPNWIEVGSVEEAESTYGSKFNENQLSKSFLTYFPNKRFGFGCAKWALESAYNLTKEFYSRMGEDTPFPKSLEKENEKL
jgi:hypothetical protein